MRAPCHGLEIGGTVICAFIDAVMNPANDRADEVAKLFCAIRNKFCR